MAITWFNEKPKEGVATLSSNSITLNKTATTFFEHAYSVMLGINEGNQQIVIKPLLKAEAMRQDIPQRKKYRITVRASYARISNKAFMSEISELFNIDLSEEAKKFPTSWDKKEGIFCIDLRGNVK